MVHDIVYPGCPPWLSRENIVFKGVAVICIGSYGYILATKTAELKKESMIICLSALSAPQTQPLSNSDQFLVQATDEDELPKRP